MTENREQELNELIERLLAGEPLDTASIDDQELLRLARLAGALRDLRLEPDAAFEASLAGRLQALRRPEQEQTASNKSARWMPGWFTWRRAAAVAATLVLGLGIAGMTQAVIRGGGPLEDDNAQVAATTEYSPGVEQGNYQTESLERPVAGTEPSTASSNVSDAAGAATPNTPGSGGIPLPDLQRVIKNADYEIEVPVGDFQDRFSEIAGIAARYGGYVISSESSVSDNGDNQLKQGVITIRVANIGDNFNNAQQDVEGLGKVISKQVSGEDVTQEYIDLQSRLRNAEAQQASLLALMAKAQTVDEILMVQSRLDGVQMEIEQLKGSIQYMDSMTDFSSFTVRLHEEDVTLDEGGKDDEAFDWGFVEAFKYAGWLAVQTVNFVIIALGVIIPSLLILGLISLAAYRIIRRRRERQ